MNTWHQITKSYLQGTMGPLDQVISDSLLPSSCVRKLLEEFWVKISGVALDHLQAPGISIQRKNLEISKICGAL